MFLQKTFKIFVLLVIAIGLAQLVSMIGEDKTDLAWLDNLFIPAYSSVAIDSEYSTELVILNTHSHPQAGDDWTVSFTTKGTANLSIFPDGQATIDDLDFISLKCDGEPMVFETMDNGGIIYPNWSCDGTAELIHLVNVAGNHTLKFQFGDQIAYAHNTLSYGSEYQFHAGTTDNISVVALDTSHFVIAYRDYQPTPSDCRGKCIIGTISGTTISYGSEYTFNEEQTTETSISKLDSAHFILTYRDGGNNDYGTAIIGTVNGSTISYGSEYTFNEENTSGISVSVLDTAHFVVAYRKNNGYGSVKIGTISGTTISYGSEYTFNEENTSGISVSVLDTAHFVVAYRKNNGYGSVKIGTISGTTISYGSEYTFNSASTYGLSVTALDSTHFVVTYDDYGNDSYGTAIIGIISGGNQIAYGSEYTFKQDTVHSTSVSKLDSTHFIVAYNYSFFIGHGRAIRGTVSGNTISYGTESQFAETSYPTVSALDADHFVISYCANYNGESIIGTYALIPTVTTQAAASIETTTATGNGNITDDGGANIIQHGVCWSTSANPTTADNHTSEGAGGEGPFASNITGLTSDVLYHYRAYAVNSQGTSYGEDRMFGLKYSYEYASSNTSTLSCATAPTITISVATSIEKTTATVNGNITNTGGDNPTVIMYWGDNDGGQGAWDYSSDPTSPLQPQGVAAFYKNVSSLNPGTLYYFSAKATNGAETDWPASSLSFTTKPDLPTGFTATAVSKTQINIDWESGTGAEKTMVRRKIGDYPSSPTDTGSDQVYFDTGTSKNDTGLSCGTHYYYRAWSFKAGAPNSGYSDGFANDDKSTFTCNQGPNAAISCDNSGCGLGSQCESGNWTAYNTHCVYKINNNSTDPNGQSDIAKSTWSILYGDGSPWQDPYILCTSNPLCNLTLPTLIPGNYKVKLTVEDQTGETDSAPLQDFTIKQGSVAGFACSLDEEGPWVDCDYGNSGFKPAIGEIVYFNDNSGIANNYSIASSGASITSRVWKKQGNIFNSGNHSTTSTVLTDIPTIIELTITDSIDRNASVSHPISVGFPLPEWKETAP